MKLARQMGLAALIGAPLGLIAAFLATPVLWRLEDVLGMELAGHSGPSERVLWGAVLLCTLAALALLRKLQKQ